MRHRRTIAVVVLVKLAVLALLVPLIAQAAAPSSPAGTYEGVGHGASGSEADSSAVTVYVEDLGSTLRFTVTVHRVDATFSTEGAKPSGSGAGTVPLTVDSMGVKGTGSVTLTPQDGGWVMTGEGSGSGFGQEGSATLQATQVSTGVSRPGLGQQVSNMVSALFGGPPQAGTASEPTTTVATSQSAEAPNSWFAPAQAKPPLTVVQQASSAGLGLLALLVAVFLA